MDDDSLAVIVAGFGVFLYCVSTALEESIQSLVHTKIRGHHLDQANPSTNKNPARVDSVINHAANHLLASHATRLVGAILVSIVVISEWTSPTRRESWPVVLLALLVVAILALIGTIIRLVAVHNPAATVDRLYAGLKIQSLTIGLFTSMLLGVQSSIAKRFGLRSELDFTVSPTELIQAQATSAREAGLLHEDGNEMIQSIFELVTTTVREVMVPRIDVIALPASANLDEAFDVMRERGYSRIPVYEETIDDVIGILYAKDLFRYVRRAVTEEPIRPLIRPAYFIPESKKNADLLRELQRRHVHMAIVADEYGGTAGIVTIEDLLEEIVGEIQDEYDTHEETKVVRLNDNETIIDAKMSISDVNNELELSLKSEDVDTIGGLLYEKLGRVPMLGDQAEVEGAFLKVESTAGRRMRKVRVIRRDDAGVAMGAND